MKLFNLAATVALVLTGCAITENRTAQISSRLRNNDGTLVVVFRNNSKQIVSFDYTIADGPNTVHVDADGPNSGLIENLYPGSEKEVPHPMQKSVIWTKIGAVTYGKRTNEELAQIYRPTAAVGSTGLVEPSLMPAEKPVTQ